MDLPSKLNRRAVTLNFSRLTYNQWHYFFDMEKKNGLYACRLKRCVGNKHVWYSTAKVVKWLLDNGYYAPGDFAPPSAAPVAKNSPWAPLMAKPSFAFQ